MRCLSSTACYHKPVRRLRNLVAAFAIALMVFPPLFDTFDSWDKGVELPFIGHNTETNIVIATAELGICFVVAVASVLFFSWVATFFKSFAAAFAPAIREPHKHATDYLLLLYSPPWHTTALRI